MESYWVNDSITRKAEEHTDDCKALQAKLLVCKHPYVQKINNCCLMGAKQDGMPDNCAVSQLVRTAKPVSTY